MPRVLEHDDEFFEPRSSPGSSSLLPQWMPIDSQPRRNPSYKRISQGPLTLTIHKLDGSSFAIEVAQMGTVGDLKHAVEEAFCHLPKNGSGGVSWGHVWGQFCLCFEGIKLLSDSDCLGMFGIDDGDQLQFIRHCSSNNMEETESEAEAEDLDSDYESTFSNSRREEPDNDEPACYHRIDIEDNLDDSDTDLDKYSAISERQSSISHFFRCWFRYSKLSHSPMRTEKRSSFKNSGSFKDAIQLYSDTTTSRRETWKRSMI